ncbi:MAG: DNA modification methylase, partial [Thermoplasmatales archaeon]|nr:DNA modification methylase [Thermoplasmatales archaeon]
MVRELADVYTKDRDVILENPDNEIRGLITDSKVYVGLKTAEINRSQFEERKIQHRPFFSPISLHPKLARALVNLSSIKKDETLLDPFCGTGGILLEAGL